MGQFEVVRRGYHAGARLRAPAGRHAAAGAARACLPSRASIAKPRTRAAARVPLVRPSGPGTPTTSRSERPTRTARAANSVGLRRSSARSSAIPPRPADEADVRHDGAASRDVRDKATLADYDGASCWQGSRSRITDRYNGDSQAEPATVADVPLEVAVPVLGDRRARRRRRVRGQHVARRAAPGLGAARARARSVQLGTRGRVYDGGDRRRRGHAADNTLLRHAGSFRPVDAAR